MTIFAMSVDGIRTAEDIDPTEVARQEGDEREIDRGFHLPKDGFKVGEY